MKFATGILTFVVVAVTAAFILAFPLGGLGAGIAWISMALGLVAGVVVGWQTRDEAAPPLKVWDCILLICFALASLRAFLWLIYIQGDEIKVLSPNNLGDLSLHLNFIRYFANGVPFWPESPILTGTPLVYPAGIDIFNALLETLHVDTFRGLIATGLVLAGVTGWILWRWGGAFGIAALLFNGGLAGFVFLKTGMLNDYQTTLVWKNLFLSMFVTQRGLLVAIPVGLLLLSTWREEWFRGGKPIIPRWAQWMLYATLPLFNLHAFLFASLVLLAIFIAKAPSRIPLMIFVGAAFVPAAIIAYMVTGGLQAGGLHAGWELREGVGIVHWLFDEKSPAMDQSPILGVLWDFGLTIPIGIILVLYAAIWGNAESRCFAATAAVVFLACMLVSFARWPWDNMKLMIWSWLVIAPYLWKLLIQPLPIPARGAVCVLLFFSGAISLMGGLDSRHGYKIASRSDVAMWANAVRDIPATDTFAIEPEYNHPLLLLGRKLVCGYDGHLWSHGLDYQGKMETLKRLIALQPSWTADARTLNAAYMARRAPEGGAGGQLYDLTEIIEASQPSQSPQLPPPQSVDLPW
jgi:hypothetical protein